MPDRAQPRRTVAIVGGGPAGLVAAERLAAAGLQVDLYERTASVGRKFLLAGKGGLNLTHGEARPGFDARYGAAAATVGGWLDRFDAAALRAWAAGLGVDTFVGSSGRVFPRDLKAGPLMRAWVRRLKAAGVRLHMHHRWLGWDGAAALRFATPSGEAVVRADAVLFALGGGSWAKLGSDGAWTAAFGARGIGVAPLQPANCGFECDWSPVFVERFAGAPVKPVAARTGGSGAAMQQGEFVVTRHGVEGSLVYALSASLRDALVRDGIATLELDLLPGRSVDAVHAALLRPANGRSRTEQWRRQLGLAGVRAGLARELLDPATLADPARLAPALKTVPVPLRRTRPIDEAISTAGGVRFAALDGALMLRALPGQFCAGEMLDWDAPTGGYLLTACFASGVVAADGVLAWLGR
ncbi:TIGR03862 family flavoprotein [Chiayiivirga flava]|uniref:TIGR03862 family flavoprotein n=1 Tax=Chiayiivirga flava TaxID=659595 RepID=A0A7W8D4Q3_9GAMM|nr:hypothetical protein [Chiayiivirga flava]